MHSASVESAAHLSLCCYMTELQSALTGNMNRCLVKELIMQLLFHLLVLSFMTMDKVLCGIKYIVETKMTMRHLQKNKIHQFNQLFDNMSCFYSSLSHKREMFVCGDDDAVV